MPVFKGFAVLVVLEFDFGWKVRGNLATFRSSECKKRSGLLEWLIKEMWTMSYRRSNHPILIACRRPAPVLLKRAIPVLLAIAERFEFLAIAAGFLRT